MDVIVRKSKIEGKGVFAVRDFKKGEVVIDWSDSLILTPEQTDKLPEEDRKYIYYDGDIRVMVKPPARFVNHSCDPSAFVRNFCDIATRDIRKGEEITEDYSKEANPSLHIVCNCGSKNCKGTVKGNS